MTMNVNVKKNEIVRMSAVVFAAGLLAGLFTLPASLQQSYAAPPGLRAEDVGKMLYKFNILATPNGDWSADDNVCPNEGHRVFFERVQNGAIGTITWKLDPTATGFDIVDCDGTSDKTAVIEADESVTFWVFVRVHGKATDSLHLVCEEVIVSTNDVTGNLEDLCLIDQVTLKKSDKSFTKIMTNLVDNEYEEVLWTLDTATGFRNAEVRIMERLG